MHTFLCRKSERVRILSPPKGSDFASQNKEDYKIAKRIITISREFGSGGRFIGEEVAKKLGIAYYDKDIIGQIAEQSGFITGVY